MDVEISFIPHFTDAESMHEMIQEGVREEFFYNPDIKKMFILARDYYVDAAFEHVVTMDLLKDDYGDWFSRNELDPEHYTVGFLTDRIKTRYRRNQTQAIIRDIGVLSVEDPEAALVKGLGDMSRLQFETSTKDRTQIYPEGYGVRVAQYFEEVHAPGEISASMGVPLAFDALTSFTYGLQPREFALFIGGPGTGKSWVMAQVALKAALNGHKVYFASLENSQLMTLMRLDCLLTEVPWEDYFGRTLNMEHTAALKKVRDSIADFGLENLVVDTPRYATERSVFELYTRAKFMDADVLVGDQISWVTPRDSYRGDQSMQMVEKSSDIADFSREMGIASCWAAQFNREGARAGKPKLQDIALSTNLEQVIDFGFALYRTEELEAEEKMLLSMLKSRRTKKETWLCDWSLTRKTKLDINKVWNGD